jgi:hypothetical protein
LLDQEWRLGGQMGKPKSKFSVSVVVHSGFYKEQIKTHVQSYLTAIPDVALISDYRDSDFNVDVAGVEYDDQVFLSIHFERSIRGQLLGLMALTRNTIMNEIEEKKAKLSSHGITRDSISNLVENLADEKVSNIWKIIQYFYVMTLDRENLQGACKEIVDEFDSRCLADRRVKK